MLYTIITTHADGTTTTTTTQATTARDAHQQATTTTGDTVRVYPATTDDRGNIIADGVQAGALMVVRRTTANMISREGGDLQYRLYNACRVPGTDDPDVLDCLSVASLAIVEAISDGEPIAEQYHRAYLALNRHLRSSRQIDLSATAQRTLYIEDINGEIVNVTGEIGRILSPGERYTPTEEGTPNTVQAAAIRAIVATLTPTQITVLRYLAKGWSERQICDTMHRSKTTIHQHITYIRRKAVALYPDGCKAV